MPRELTPASASKTYAELKRGVEEALLTVCQPELGTPSPERLSPRSHERYAD